MKSSRCGAPRLIVAAHSVGMDTDPSRGRKTGEPPIPGKLSAARQSDSVPIPRSSSIPRLHLIDGPGRVEPLLLGFGLGTCSGSTINGPSFSLTFT